MPEATSFEERFNALSSLVREARIEDARTCQAMAIATDRWKEANRILTDRLKVLNDYVAQRVNEATRIDEAGQG